jgi:hypothetical protein
MRRRFARLSVLTAVIVPLGVTGVFAASASAEAGPTCTGGSGEMKLSPGLTETAQIQKIAIKGKLSGCETPAHTATSATYKVTEETSEPVSCATVEDATYNVKPGSVSIKWKGKGIGTSTGMIGIPLSVVPEVGFTGMVESGAFAESKIAGTVTETLKGTCGVGKGGKKPKPVKSTTMNVSKSNSY